MTTVTAPWWLWWVLGFLVAAGVVAVCWVAAGWAERAAGWLRTRRELVDDYVDLPEDPDGLELGVELERLLGLPPERTWEQMTSHQLPVVADRDGNIPTDRPPYWRPPDLSAMQERRAPWWEAEQRQAYAALGLEFPSGLLARMREAAQ